ncbi:hypothetical protein BJY01DRAFT_10653 [Aspergillus pseudoustus]|uniref:Uncharacterized protein n=1 Tax=Aspergillus pseudoustus TaxID=1810923 RepID=A0ABR4KSR4_9EURO
MLQTWFQYSRAQKSTCLMSSIYFKSQWQAGSLFLDLQFDDRLWILEEKRVGELRADPDIPGTVQRLTAESGAPLAVIYIWQGKYEPVDNERLSWAAGILIVPARRFCKTGGCPETPADWAWLRAGSGFATNQSPHGLKGLDLRQWRFQFVLLASKRFKSGNMHTATMLCRQATLCGDAAFVVLVPAAGVS